MTIDQLTPEPDAAHEAATIARTIVENELVDEGQDSWRETVVARLEEVRLEGRERARRNFVGKFSLPEAFTSAEAADEAASAYKAAHGLSMVTVELRPVPWEADFRDGSFRVIPQAAADEIWKQWWLTDREERDGRLRDPG